jgi:uncharacterized protein (TIGR00251 family)
MERLENYKKLLIEKNELYLRIKVHPGCAKSELREVLEDETIKIDIAEQAEKGKANKELINFLAREFDISDKNVKIISGSGSRLKLIKIKK